MAEEQEQEPSRLGDALGRVRNVMGVTAAVAGSGVGLYAFATRRPVLRTALPITANCVVAFGMVAAAQEGVGALRGGVRDAWGALAAGAATGALLSSLQSGRPYALLGAVTWGPGAAAAHALNGWLQPGRVFRGFLVSNGLLDDPAAAAGARGAQGTAAAASASASASPPEDWRAHKRQRDAAAAEAAVAAAEAAAGVAAALAEEERRQWWWKRTRQVEIALPVELPGEEDLDFEKLSKQRQTLMLEQLKRREMRELNERLHREADERARRQQQGQGQT